MEASYIMIQTAYEEKLNKAVSLVFKELNRLKAAPISNYQLKQAKQKFKGQIALAEESRMSMIIAEAKNIIDYSKVIPLQEVFDKIDKVSAENLLELCTTYFDESKLISLSFVPEEE